jgi:hypothetical protein
MRRFVLHRVKDDSGISGTGKVLEGCVTSSGKCFCEWLGETPSDCIYPSFAAFNKIHVLSHPGTAVVVWLDSQEIQVEELIKAVQELREKLDKAITTAAAPIVRPHMNFNGTLCDSPKHKSMGGYCPDCQP